MFFIFYFISQDLKFIELDLAKFNQQMESLSQAFMEQYNESKNYLDKIETKKTNQNNQNSMSRCSSANTKQLSKYIFTNN